MNSKLQLKAAQLPAYSQIELERRVISYLNRAHKQLSCRHDEKQLHIQRRGLINTLVCECGRKWS